ncbi:phosphotyrosine protein phosphatase [Catellatospora sichuanensis]|uniref:phosphotyrosine protein phosphatase n=1 Tax=Catellatospora sichuanensis TaxID=1969805 RepID=UPI001FEB3FE5|nr:phosphotyrosine protein phosphatase [Catellatospora sichuanensis]
MFSPQTVERCVFDRDDGLRDACPVLPGKRYLDWDLPDPAGADLAVVRAIRDDIDVRVRQLIDELTAGEQR